MDNLIPEFEEDIAPAFARLLTWLAHDQGAPLFAASMAEMGCKPHSLRTMASRWSDEDFEPADGADLLLEFADAVDELTTANFGS